MRKTTLKELGHRLPIGLQQGDGLIKTFTLRPFKAKIDRHLGIWRQANSERQEPGALMGTLAIKLLSLLCEQVGPMAFPLDKDGDSTPETELKFYNWNFADVMYLYLCARIQALGPELVLSFGCPRCKHTMENAKFDLESMEVSVLEDAKELSSWVDIKHPYLLRDGKTMLRSVKVVPVKWSMLTTSSQMLQLMGTFDVLTLENAITGINGEPGEYRFLESEFDEMDKSDFLNLQHKADTLTAGVDCRTTIYCPKCKTPNTQPLNWSYDDFFGLSYRRSLS